MVSFSACGALWYFSTCFLLMLSRVWKESETGHSSDTKPTANLLLHKGSVLITCVKISLAKTLFPCFIIMLTNLLKNKITWTRVTWPDLQWQREIKHYRSILGSTWGLDHWKQSWWFHSAPLWWVWVLLAPAVPSPQDSTLWWGCCTPPSWPLAPDSKGCTCSISPGTPWNKVFERTI